MRLVISIWKNMIIRQSGKVMLKVSNGWQEGQLLRIIPVVPEPAGIKAPYRKDKLYTCLYQLGRILRGQAVF